MMRVAWFALALAWVWSEACGVAGHSAPGGRFSPQPLCAGETRAPWCDAVPDETWRRLIVVGDVHGDYGRMARVLREAGLVEVDPKSGQIGWVTALAPGTPQTDVVFAGDYVDWRGEPLEMGPTGQAIGNEGAVLVLRALRGLMQSASGGAGSGVGSKGLFGLGGARVSANPMPAGVTLTALAGNHDLMMLDAAELVVGDGEVGLDIITAEELARLTGPSTPKAEWAKVVKSLGATGQLRMRKFYNWWTQGGLQTTSGFGGMKAWAEEMKYAEGSLGEWMRGTLLLGVRVGDTHVSHTLADNARLWAPVETWASGASGAPAYCAARNDYTWGRGLWTSSASGSNASGSTSFAEADVALALRNLNATRIIVGHTQKSKRQRPSAYWDGRIINVDQHGIPGSPPFVDLVAPPADRPPAQHLVTHGALLHKACAIE